MDGLEACETGDVVSKVLKTDFGSGDPDGANRAAVHGGGHMAEHMRDTNANAGTFFVRGLLFRR